MRRSRWVSFVLLAAACAGNRNGPFVPASSLSVRSGTDITPLGDGQYLYVENNSSEPIVITSVVLLDCENTRPHCGRSAFRVRLQPGERRNVVTVRADNAGRPYSFRYTYAWEAVRTQ